MKKAKRTRHIYEEAITVQNVYLMWDIIRKTCKNKKALFYFSLNLNTNIMNICRTLKDKTYIPSRYRTFLIFEPKPRLVMSQTIRDKIVNHFIANFYLIPYLENKLIDSNVATRKGKGSQYAMELLKKYYQKILTQNPGQEIYCLKIDISKYFYSIDHEILLQKLKKAILDQDVINLIATVIAETNQDYVNQNITHYNQKFQVSIPYYLNNKGLSIGAMSSQFLAIFYLNDLDHFIKEELHCKYYIRYMDDFLILDTSVEKLKECWKRIHLELQKLKLNENKKSNIYRSSIGYTFLGYKYKVCGRRLVVSLNKKTYYRVMKKLHFLEKYDRVLYTRTLASYYGYFSPVYSLEGVDFKMKLIEKYESYKKKYPHAIVLMKEGIFYKTFYDDAKIIWYLFDYKYVQDTVSFGTSPYDKVLAQLNKLDLGYVVIDQDQEVLVSLKPEDVYASYSSLANHRFDKTNRNDKLVHKMKRIIESYPDSYDMINAFLDDIVESKKIKS